MSLGTDVPAHSFSRWILASGFRPLLMAAGLLAVFGTSGQAQESRIIPPAKPAEEEARRITPFRGSVLKQPEQIISLGVRQSVLVKTEAQCVRVESRPAGVVTADVVSDREVLLRGQTVGEAELRLFTKDGRTPVFRASVRVWPETATRPADVPEPKEIFRASARVEPVQRFKLGVNKSIIIRTTLPCRKVMTWSKLGKEEGEDKKGTVDVRAPRAPKGGAKDQEKEKSSIVITAETISPKEVLVVGNDFGTTQLLLVTEDDQCQLFEVTVEVEVDRLNDLVTQMFPDAKVHAEAVLGTIVLEGTVPNVDAGRRIIDLAASFTGSPTDVKNHLRVLGGQITRSEGEVTIESLNAAIKETAPHAKVRARRVLDTIILEGQVPDGEMAQRIMEIAEVFQRRETAKPDDQDIQSGGDPSKSDQNGSSSKTEVKNHMQVAGVQQVLLRCTVAEVSKTALRELGFNGWLAGDNVRDMFVVNQISGINPSNIGAAADALVAPVALSDIPPRVPFLTGNRGIPLQPTVPLSVGFPRAQMQLFINAMRQNNLLRVLAEPNLMAISGQTANFRVGGEFAYPIPQRDGVPSVDFKDFGVELTFTPTVLADQRIRLRIMPEVSEPDDTIGTVIQNTAVPGKSLRQLETVVEVGNGQTLALAGLLSEKVRGITQKVPGLGDLPVVGALFSSTRYQRQTTELLILCTPELVSPMNPDQVPPVPGQEMTPPNDWQFFGLGQLEGDKRPAPTQVQRALETQQPVRTYKQRNNAPEQHSALPLQGPWGVATADEGR